MIQKQLLSWCSLKEHESMNWCVFNKPCWVNWFVLLCFNLIWFETVFFLILRWARLQCSSHWCRNLKRSSSLLEERLFTKWLTASVEGSMFSYHHWLSGSKCFCIEGNLTAPFSLIWSVSDSHCIKCYSWDLHHLCFWVELSSQTAVPELIYPRWHIK